MDDADPPELFRGLDLRLNSIDSIVEMAAGLSMPSASASHPEPKTRIGLAASQWLISLVSQPDYNAVIYKQQMSPPFVLRVSCLSLEATRSAVAFPLTVQAELYDDRGQLIANEVDSESGMRPVTRNTIGLPLEAFTSTGGSGSGPVSFGRAGHEATVSFERLRINKTNRGKANFLQFLVFAHASDGSGQVVLLAQSDAVRVVVSSNSDHHRDIAAREVWLALGGVTAKPRESLPAPQVLLWVSENLYSHTGRGLSEWEKKKFADALATCGGMCSFEWFRDVLWRQLHEAEKSLRRTPTLLSMWQANLVYGFASREESVAQLAGEGAREGDCLVRFSDSKAGCIVVSVLRNGQAVEHFLIESKTLVQTPLPDFLRDRSDVSRIVAADRTRCSKDMVAPLCTSPPVAQNPVDAYFVVAPPPSAVAVASAATAAAASVPTPAKRETKRAK